jgi:hypothetical protein
MTRADVVRTAALGPEDGDDGVGEAPPPEPRGGGEPLHGGRVHLAVRAHHLRRVALAAGSDDAPRRVHRSSPLARRRTEASSPRVAVAAEQRRRDGERASELEREREARRRAERQTGVALRAAGVYTWFYGRNRNGWMATQAGNLRARKGAVQGLPSHTWLQQNESLYLNHASQ